MAKDSTATEIELWKERFRWSANQLRHTAGTEARKLFGVEGAQLILGHSRVTTTQVYAEINDAKYAEIIKAIG